MLGIEQNVLFALALTLFAGLSTTIGSAIAFFTSRTNTKMLSLALGFSAGVMIYVSFVEILGKSQVAMVQSLGEKWGMWGTALAFFGGILLIALIDLLVPNYENPHEIYDVEDLESKRQAAQFKKLQRVGVLTALALAIHNFPEGFATFMGALVDPSVGIAIAIAIAIHNIPEGISVSIPIYYATGSKKKAFAMSFLSGLAEPVGAVIGYLILRNYINDLTFGIVFGVVAGIMVFISLDELLPSAQKYGQHHLSIYGLIAGMGVMALSLLMFV